MWLVNVVLSNLTCHTQLLAQWKGPPGRALDLFYMHKSGMIINNRFERLTGLLEPFLYLFFL